MQKITPHFFAAPGYVHMFFLVRNDKLDVFSAMFNRLYRNNNESVK